MELYKGKGSTADPAAYRDACLASSWAKLFGKCWRTRLAERLGSMGGQRQFGAGLNSGDTTTAHLLLKSMIEAAEVLNKTAGVLFVDVVAAFPSLMRNLVFDTVDGDEALFTRLAALGFDSRDIENIKADLVGTPWMTGHLTFTQKNMLEKLHSHTWCTIDGVTGVLKTKQGTTAGLPLSDAVFIAAIGRVVWKIEQQLRSEGLLCTAAFSGKHEEAGVKDLRGFFKHHRCLR